MSAFDLLDKVGPRNKPREASLNGSTGLPSNHKMNLSRKATNCKFSNERAYNVFGAESNSSKYQLLMYSVSYRPRYTANGPDKPPSGASNEVLYDKLGNHSLDAAFLFQTFKEVKETKAPAGFIYEDLIGYQLHLGGQRPIVSMKKTPKKQEYVHLRTTGNKEGDAYLRLGQDAPFGFMTAPLPSDTFGRLKKIFYVHDGKLVLESVTFRR